MENLNARIASDDLTAWTTKARNGVDITAQQAEWVARNDTAQAAADAARAEGIANGSIPEVTLLSPKADRLAAKAASASINAAYKETTEAIINEIIATY